MAWYPGAVRRNIAPGRNDPPIIPIGMILHVDANNSPSLFNYFNGPSKGIESHFHVPKKGKPEQYRSTGYEADANYKANSFWRNGKRFGFISVETQGYGEGIWNDHQLTEIKDLIWWGHIRHGFPLRKCSNPYDYGVGYHTLFPRIWTPITKSCPGPERIEQFNDIIVPWMRAGGNKKEAEDVSYSKWSNKDKQEFFRDLKLHLGDAPFYDAAGTKRRFHVLIRHIMKQQDGITNMAKRLVREVGSLPDKTRQEVIAALEEAQKIEEE